MNGGYQIVDLNKISFTSGTAQTIPGIYNLIKSNNKFKVFTNLVIGGVEYPDLIFSLTLSSTNYVGYIPIVISASAIDYISISISNSDSVTITKSSVSLGA